MFYSQLRDSRDLTTTTTITVNPMQFYKQDLNRIVRTQNLPLPCEDKNTISDRPSAHDLENV